MRKFSQAELLNEAFRDIIAGAAKVAGKVTKAAAGVISPTAVGVYDKAKAGANSLIDTYQGEQPLAVLKKTLEKNPHIEFIKLIKQEQRTANPNKGRFQSKNVTLITFEATVYKKGLERSYKVYEATNSLSVPSNNLSVPSRNISQIGGRVGGTRAQRLPGGSDLSIPKQTAGMKQARGRVIDAETPRLPGSAASPPPLPPEKSLEQDGAVKTLTAEVFRTSEGLQVGEIYDTATGTVYYSGKKDSSKPVFSTTITNYKGTTAGGYAVKNILAYFKRELRLTDGDAKNIVAGATNLTDLIAKATGVAVADINTIIPDAEISKIGDALRSSLYVESKLNHKELIEKTLLLEKFTESTCNRDLR